MAANRRNAIREQPWLYKKYWTEEEYLALETNYLIEFNDGILEVLPMPDFFHQSIALRMAKLVEAFSEAHRPGFLALAPFRMKVSTIKYREADVVFLFEENADKFANEVWTGADLAIEIISAGGRKRDTVHKRADYAAAGISEYWIIDPQNYCVTVLTLVDNDYVEHGIFKKASALPLWC